MNLEKIDIGKLVGLNVGNLYELIFIRARAMIEKNQKFCGYYQSRNLFISPEGELLIEPNPS